MNFIKTSIYSAASTTISLLVKLITNKVIAVFLGTNGMFLIENHIFCTQGHIELDKKFARMIYDFRKNQIGNHKHQHACETLTMQTDEHEIVESLLKFLKK